MEQGQDGGQGAQVGDDDVEQEQGGNGEDVMLIVDSPSDEDSLLVMIKGQWSISKLCSFRNDFSRTLQEKGR